MKPDTAPNIGPITKMPITLRSLIPSHYAIKSACFPPNCRNQAI